MPATEPQRLFLTADIPALDAAFRESPEDFVVEEVPVYLPCGVGTHTFVTIEKRGVSTHEAVRGIARRLGRRPGEIGVAGLKDAKAVATQTISIEHVKEGELERVEEPGKVRVVAVGRHTNKLKTGHLKGNRFRVTLRPGTTGALDAGAARAAMDRLAAVGLPNPFGLQRFGGAGGETHRLGRALLRKDAVEFVRLLVGERRSFPGSFVAEKIAVRVLSEGGDAAKVVRAIPKEQKRLYYSAAQSAVFNAVLEERLRAGTLGTLEAGDVAFLHRNGAVFLVGDAAAEAPRAAAFELSPSGPLPGARCLPAAGLPAERERAALAGFGLTEADVAELPGARRPLRVRVEEAAVASGPDGSLVLSFFLPAGSYATAVISELLKREVG